MSKVTIYTGMMCGFCSAAKRLLETKGVAFDEIDVTFNRAARAEMHVRANGATSVPQIFIGATHVGGSDDLYRLGAGKGKLDGLLQGSRRVGLTGGANERHCRQLSRGARPVAERPRD